MTGSQTNRPLRVWKSQNLMTADIKQVQKDLRAAKLNGWLFYDFRGRDPIAHRLLQLPSAMRTRRWFYFIPANGSPKKLLHKIETAALDTLPGSALYYAGHKKRERK